MSNEGANRLIAAIIELNDAELRAKASNRKFLPFIPVAYEVSQDVAYSVDDILTDLM